MRESGPIRVSANHPLLSPLAIPAMSLITPFGITTQANWRQMVGLQLQLRGSTEVPLLREQLEEQFPQSPGLRSLDRAVQLALLAARSALRQTHVPRLTDDDGLFIATSKGPIQTLLKAGSSGLAMDQLTAEHIVMGPAAIGVFLRRYLGEPTICHTSVAACAGALVAVHAARRAILTGACRRALVVAADSSIHPLFDASFARLGILAPADEQGRRTCEPFDPQGRGFFISEAAAALILERSDAGNVFLQRTWVGGDGTDLLAIDPDARRLRQGLALLADCDHIDFVHAHATGTRHDLYERQAIAMIRPDFVFSHKRFLGHSLGASGLVALVLSILCHQNGTTLDWQPIGPSARSITIAQGFGGHIGLARLASGGQTPMG